MVFFSVNLFLSDRSFFLLGNVNRRLFIEFKLFIDLSQCFFLVLVFFICFFFSSGKFFAETV